MKAKQNFSDLDDRKYIGRVLAVAGVFFTGAAAAVAWPGLSHIAHKLIG
ncbi:MAG: hypothetical protein LWW87_10955 [Geobacteraceae bacterium]|jgi:hypothetical protein|nr:hypothetical protein [Geobacteraceae bacterium]